MNGIVEGGWGYVLAAYAATALALGGYGLLLWRRLRAEARP